MLNLIGQTLDNYRIEAFLGAGGMGRVYRARHIVLDRPTALKVMHEHLATDGSFRERFVREARSVAALEHPNIVRIYDSGESHGLFYIAMELVEGGSLRTYITQHPQQPNAAGGAQAHNDLALVLAWIAQAADGLTAAHLHGIVHRDITPDNILLQAHGSEAATVKLCDFGLVRVAQENSLTQTGLVIGTPAYMSPEQCQGLPLDARSDLYSLGAVMYEAVTGQTLFQVKSLSEAVYKHVYTPPEPPRGVRADLPEPVEQVILRCLAKNPDARYPSARALSAAIRDIIRQLSESSQTQLGSAPTPPPDAALPAATVVQPGEPSAEVRTQVYEAGTERRRPPPDTQIGFVAPPQPSQVHLKLDEGRTLLLTPGQPAVCFVTLLNSGKQPQAYDLKVEGVPEAWVQITRLIPQIDPGVGLPVAITVLAPREPDSKAMAYAVTLRAISRSQPTDTATVMATWTVLPFAAASLQIAPALAAGPVKAAYRVTLHNAGNAPTTYTLSGADEEAQLAYDFGPQASVQLDPGKSAQLSLTVRGPMRVFGAAQLHPFQVRATPGDGTTGQIVSARFRNAPVVVWWLPLVILGILVLFAGLENGRLSALIASLQPQRAPAVPAAQPKITLVASAAVPAVAVPKSTDAPTAVAAPAATIVPASPVPTAVLAPTLFPTPLPPTPFPTLLPTPIPVANFSGIWWTNFAQMSLSQDAEGNVSGSYQWYGDTEPKTLQGQVVDHRFVGTFGGDPDQQVELNLNVAGTAFDGMWRNTRNNATGHWCGVQSGPLPDGCGFGGRWFLDGSFDSEQKTNFGPYVADLRQTGTHVEGEYFDEEGSRVTVSGEVGVKNRWGSPHYTLSARREWYDTNGVLRGRGTLIWQLQDYNSNQFRGMLFGKVAPKARCGYREGFNAPNPCELP